MNFSFNSIQNIFSAKYSALSNEYLYDNIAANAGLKINAVASEVLGSFQGDMENVKAFASTYKDELIPVDPLRLLATAVPVLQIIDNSLAFNTNHAVDLAIATKDGVVNLESQVDRSNILEIGIVGVGVLTLAVIWAPLVVEALAPAAGLVGPGIGALAPAVFVSPPDASGL